MMYAKLGLCVVCVLMLSGCALEGNGICIDGRDLVYDGQKASGMVRIVDCRAFENSTLHSMEIDNKTVYLPDEPAPPADLNISNETFENLPLIG